MKGIKNLIFKIHYHFIENNYVLGIIYLNTILINFKYYFDTVYYDNPLRHLDSI